VEVLRNRPDKFRGDQRNRSVVTIGNFDGVHLGHQALLRRCAELAGKKDVVSVVTFEPLPQAVFKPEAAPARLTTVYQKLAQLRAAKVHRTWMLRFDASLAALSARDFVTAVLLDGLAARCVVVGEDFRFGHRREGNVAQLRILGEEFGFGVEITPAVYLGVERISSTAIRSALAKGNLERAAKMLGRPYRMEGHVVVGQQLGRKLGYPTANLRIRARPAAVQGVFAVYVRVPVYRGDLRGHHSWLPGVSSLGWRPTVGGQEPLLELHLFDFERDLYGQRLDVEFVAKLRDEANFEAIEPLVAQMHRDEGEARLILENTARPD
jgi:riboflavin kinase / FMN adenylyltransferase